MVVGWEPWDRDHTTHNERFQPLNINIQNTMSQAHIEIKTVHKPNSKLNSSTPKINGHKLANKVQNKWTCAQPSANSLGEPK